MTTKEVRSATPRGYVTAAYAAEAAGVSLRSLLRWCEAGAVKGARRQEWTGRYGYRWLVPVRWVEAQR